MRGLIVMALAWTEVDAGMGTASVASLLFIPPGDEEDIRASAIGEVN